MHHPLLAEGCGVWGGCAELIMCGIMLLHNTKRAHCGKHKKKFDECMPWMIHITYGDNPTAVAGPRTDGCYRTIHSRSTQRYLKTVESHFPTAAVGTTAASG